MQTNRIKFQNIDQSFSLGTSTAINGACVIKAPKGLNIPQYIQKSDTSTLLNLFGAPSSSYPGIQEALDYLSYYSLWISAPGGSGSYFGGTYLTTLGSLEPFYGVTENTTGAPSVNFLTKVTPGNNSPLAGVATKALGVGNSTITVSNIPSQFFLESNLTNVILEFTRSNGTSAQIIYNLDTINNNLVIGGTVYGTYTSNSITLNANNSYLDSSGLYYDMDWTSSTHNPNFANSGFTVSWVYNIQTYVCMALYQNSPRNIAGTFSLNTPFAVDTRQLIYPQYLATYNILYDGISGGIPVSTIFNFTICGIPISFTTSNSTPITTTSALVVAIQNAMKSIYIPGYTFAYAGSQITITYTGSMSTPTLAFTTSGTGFSPAFEVTYQFIGSSTIALSGDITFNGITLNVSSISTTADLVNNIASTFSSSFPNYVFNTTNAALGKLTVIYPTSVLITPSISIGSALVGFTSSVISQAINPQGIVKTNPYYNTVTFSYSEVSYTGNTYNNTFTVSPDSTKTDLSGNNLYAETILNGNNFLGAISYQPLYNLSSGFSWGIKSTTLKGIRYVSSSSFNTSDLPTTLLSGWNEMSLPEMQNSVNVFFDPECIPAVASVMASLRTTSYPFSTFITGIKVSDGVTTSPSAIANVVNDIIAARAHYPDATGLAYYCNEFYMTENYSSTSYWNIPIGSAAAMLSLIQDYRLGGAAPMFTNEGNPAIGGQLSKSVIRQKYNFDAGSLDLLDSNGINPIVYDTYYGLMITSQKTAQSSLNLTDWSYLGHQMSFDLFEAEIKQNVMLPQIGKLIDGYHMNLRKTQAQIILNKRLQGATAIWSDGQIYVNEVNTPKTLAQNTFVIKIRVKVTPFSEYVELIFNNVAQTSSVTTQ